MLDHTAEPIYEECKVYDGEEAVRRLRKMELRTAYFEAAVMHGHDLASRVSPIHPRVYAGWIMWAETVFGLRTQLLDLNADWVPGSTNNCETSYHLERGIAIAVVGGDSSTGERAFRSPKATRKRGPAIAKRISRNVLGQDVLDLPEFHELEEDEQCDLWFFLLNARKGSMYTELSLPMSVGSDNRIGIWRERILMPPVPLAGVVVTPDDNGDEEPPEVYVGRK